MSDNINYLGCIDDIIETFSEKDGIATQGTRAELILALALAEIAKQLKRYNDRQVL